MRAGPLPLASVIHLTSERQPRPTDVLALRAAIGLHWEAVRRRCEAAGPVILNHLGPGGREGEGLHRLCGVWCDLCDQSMLVTLGPRVTAGGITQRPAMFCGVRGALTACGGVWRGSVVTWFACGAGVGAGG